MEEPVKIRSGVTTVWTKDLPDYSASDSWALKYRLAGTTANYPVTSVGVGTAWTVTITADTSKSWVAGTYTLLGYVEKGTGASVERHDIFIGTVEVLPNIAEAVSASDLRTHARKTLALIESAIESYAVRPVEEIMIAGRTIRRPKLEQLVSFRAKYRFLVKQEEMAERAANGLEAGGGILVKFNQVR